MEQDSPKRTVRCPLQTAAGRGAEEAQLLLDYCARKLPPEEMAAFERHVENCVDCRSFRDRQRAVWEALEAWEAEPVRPDFNRGVWGEVGVLEGESGWRKLKRGAASALEGISLKPAIPLAAVFSAWLLVVSWQAPRTVEPPPEQGESLERIIEDMELVEQIPLTVQ
jgi:hypothetical protein